MQNLVKLAPTIVAQIVAILLKFATKDFILNPFFLFLQNCWLWLTLDGTSLIISDISIKDDGDYTCELETKVNIFILSIQDSSKSVFLHQSLIPLHLVSWTSETRQTDILSDSISNMLKSIQRLDYSPKVFFYKSMIFMFSIFSHPFPKLQCLFLHQAEHSDCI